MRSTKRDPIAIIGIGCRFPGGITDPDSFWRLLCEGIDAVTEVPASRFDAAALFSETPAPGRIGSVRGGFLDGIDTMDARFFGLSPREAERLDPQQRLLLETAWEALEDAGVPAGSLQGSRAGVFTGLWLNDFEARLFADPAVDFHMTTGSGRYAASGRISYTLGLQGPSMTVDTACSSSLVAVHLACRSLWSGECPVALAGGANVILQPHVTIAYSQSGMMAADGRCKFGDARANGYVRSEGAAMVLLKPLSQALADGDRVYAVIHGSAVNNDGRSGDYMTTPAQQGQEQMLRLAYEDAGVSPGAVSYVEAHGTGTAVGDPVEIGALSAVLRTGRAAGQRCAAGSVKTNFGHTEGAAGVAGLIKAALVLRHREIPPTLHLQQPNPAVDWAEVPLFIPTERTPLATGDATAYAGVSSFGIAGTNAHVVLGEAPAQHEAAEPAQDDGPVIIPLSARSPAALRARAGQLADRLAAADAPPLRDVAFTAALRRTHDICRAAVAGSDRAELVEQLRALAASDATDHAAATARTSAPTVVFVFPGQGSQWLGMGRRLLDHEPVFRAVIEQCEEAMRPFVDWSLLEQLQLAEDDPRYRLHTIDVIQPTLVAVDLAIASLWRSWGIEPAAVIGHSMGEVAAACFAGALDLPDAMRVICVRSTLLRRISGSGAMAVVELSHDDAREAIAGFEDRVAIAASNSPLSTILSGDPAALREIIDLLERRQVFCRSVNVDVASHSPQVDVLTDDLLQGLRGMKPAAARVALHSTVLNEPLAGAELAPEYWIRNLRQPVLLAPTLQRLLHDGHDVFLEVSPHPVLLPAIEQTIQHAGTAASVFGSLRRDEDEQLMLLSTLARLYAAGCEIDWQRVCGRGRLTTLPCYPWQRERFWIERQPHRATSPSGAAAHPLLPEMLRSANGTQLWQGDISTVTAPFLADHRVAGDVLLPAAAMLEFGAAAAAAMGFASASLEEFQFEHTIVPGDEDRPGSRVQVSVEQRNADSALLTVFSRTPAAAATAGVDSWTRCARGRVVRRGTVSSAPAAPPLALAPADGVPGARLYDMLRRRGLDYGVAFRGIREFWRSGSSAVASVALPPSLDGSDAGYQIHPVLLDCAFQLLLATLNDEDDDGVIVPVAVQRLQLHRRPPGGSSLWAYAVRCASTDGLRGDVLLCDDGGNVFLSAEGVQFRAMPSAPHAADPASEHLYRVEWQQQDHAGGQRAAAGTPATAPGHWLVLGDGETVASLVGVLQASGDRCTVVSAADEGDALDRVVAELHADRRGVRGVVHICGDAVPAAAGAVDDRALPDALQTATLKVLRLAQALAKRTWYATPRLWLVTRNAQPGAAPAAAADATGASTLVHSAIRGLAAVIRNEHPELRCACVDLDDDVSAAMDLLGAELRADGDEDQIAFRQGARLVARLVRGHVEQPSDVEHVRRRRVAAPFAAETRGAGVLENMQFRRRPRRAPGPGEVEIQVQAVGLNFMNVMSALGTYPGYPGGVGPLGIECAGVISAAGEGAHGLCVGDRVVAVAFDCLATHAIADARLVAPMPGGVTLEQAAATPIAFLTASYALEHLARLEAGERVLIHSAAGGVGLAAVQIARRAGAEVIATAGTEEKREFLHSLGILHVLDSRAPDFADHVLAATDGEGVDVVLNSLSGDAIARGLSVLRPFGRFVELGKRDIHEGASFSLDPFRRQLSFFAVDLDRAARERPDLLGRMLHDVVRRVEAGTLAPLPLQAWDTAQAVDAFHCMARGQHIGKLVIRMQPTVEVPGTSVVRAEASYLVTGGRGALGLATARWLAEEGAGTIVLMGRGSTSPEAAAAIAELESMGTRVVLEQGDVSSRAEVERVLARIDATMPPLCGVIHAAGLLADATLLQLDAEQFTRPVRPKVHGAWNLHCATLERSLDFFVLFSSITAELGIPGQANYAAANAFMDALAQTRRAGGRAALSIGWGPWSTIGLAAVQQDRGQRLGGQGLGSMDPERCVRTLAALLSEQGTGAHVVVARLDAERWADTHPGAARSPYLTLLRGSSEAAPAPASTATMRALLAAAAGTEREQLLEVHIRSRAAQVLRTAAERISVHQPLKTLGMDSLMSLELRNRLEADLGVAIPATMIWNYPTVTMLARQLSATVAPGSRPAVAAPAAGAAAPPRVLPLAVAVEQADVEAQLERELADIDELLKGS